MLGCGTVGGATARILQSRGDELLRRAGVAIDLVAVAVRDPAKPRAVELDRSLLTADARGVVVDDAVDVVVETIGGVDPALELVLAAIERGKHVVTANKELISTRGKEVLDAAEAAGVDVLFEASVAGGIPIIRPLKESLSGDEVVRVTGIVNGTTNFVLTRMSETGAPFEAALLEAQTLGYAEADPTADVEGHDAAAKLAILASIAFNARIVADDVVREGISTVTPADIRAARDLGYAVKLVALAERQDGQVSARVHPAMVPLGHPLASVRDVYNAVFVEAEESGELMFFGRGAGGAPTAAAVVGDVVEIARNIATGGRSPRCTWYHAQARMRPASDARVRYYAVLSVLDEPGVLAAVAGVFAQHDVSIASVRQEGRGDEATLVLITHAAPQGRHDLVFSDLGGLDAVRSIESTMRVQGTHEQ